MATDEHPEQDEQQEHPEEPEAASPPAFDPEAASPPAFEPESASRPAPKKPGSDTEKIIGLEVARLFGVSPRLLVHPDPAPAPPPPAEGTAGEDGDDEESAGE